MSETDIPPDVRADDLTLFKMHIDLLNSERQAIWARYAAMLVANSFILTAIKSEAAPTEAGLNIFLSLLGICLCLIWAIITDRGWYWFNRSLSRAKSLKVQGNPFSHTEYDGTEDRFRTDPIYLCALIIICIFVVMYVATMLHFHRLR